VNPASGRRIKDTVKRGVKSAVRCVGSLAPRPAASTRILTYHSVGNRAHEMNVAPPAFKEQMTWLANHETVITLDAAVAGTPGVSITFDDGYVDNYENAAPILHALEIPATVFVVSGWLGRPLPDDPEPESGRLMTPRDITGIQRLGVSIGAHTVNHARLAALDEDTQRNEILGAKKQLEDIVGRPLAAFAYPYGSALDYTETTTRLVEEAGFAYAVSNRYGPVRHGDNRWTLRRIWIDATDNLESFRAKVDGRLDPLALLDTTPAILARRFLNRALRTR